MVIAHNLAAMNAQRQYGITTSDKKKTTERLSSGYKINRAADDAAGLTISEKMRSQIRGLNQGSDNIQDGVSVVQIADGALAEVNDMLHRMTELSVKAANGTNTDEDRAAIQKEIHEIIEEIDRIHESTEFNTMKLFDGEMAKLGGGSKLGGLVKCGAADTGRMTENYKNLGMPSAIVDFSPINTLDKAKQLQGKSFSFGCSAGCAETFKFKFLDKDDTTPSSLKSDVSGEHYFEINIEGMSTGADIVGEIYNTVLEAVKNKQLTYASTPSDSSMGTNSSTHISTDEKRVAVGHANALIKDSEDKLVIFGVGTTLETLKASAPRWDGDNWGRVDVSEIIIPPEEVGEMKPFWIQCSGSKEDGLTIEIEKMNAKYLKIDDVDVSTQNGAKGALEKITDASAHVSAMRSDLGAYQNRLEHAYANNENKAENTTAAESRIRDTDMAAEMVKLSTQNILQQAGESMMAQANQSTQGVMSLLQ